MFPLVGAKGVWTKIDFHLKQSRLKLMISQLSSPSTQRGYLQNKYSDAQVSLKYSQVIFLGFDRIPFLGFWFSFYRLKESLDKALLRHLRSCYLSNFSIGLRDKFVHEILAKTRDHNCSYRRQPRIAHADHDLHWVHTSSLLSSNLLRG